MAALLEIIMPVRNPGPVLSQSIASLIAQTDRRFQVLLSDNFSTKGLDHLDDSVKELKALGIEVARVKPPNELGRVEHWNWAHAQARAEWLKPLFVGDLLKPDYAARILARVEKRPAADLIRCEFETKSTNGTTVTKVPFTLDTLSPADFLRYFPALGNWLGGPINMCYRRSAWQAAGGYAVGLPACADYNFNVRLALEHGLETVHECLATFQLHDQRFSHGIVNRRVNGSFEVWLVLRQARNYCLNANLPWPRNGVFRGTWRQLSTDYWQPLKHRLKSKLRGKSS